MRVQLDRVRENAVRVVNENGRSDFVLVCEHASNAAPPGSDEALWPRDIMEGHQAFDLGAAELTVAIAHLIDAPAVLAGVTRLFYDINRLPGDPECSPAQSGGLHIPANLDISHSMRVRRFEAVAAPFHHAVDSLTRGRSARIIAVHSCTPQVGDFVRPWHVGIIYEKHSALVEHLLNEFAADETLVVGDNQPYSGMEVPGYTLWRHAEFNDCPAAALEFRNDVIASEQARRAWSERTAEVLGSYGPR